MILREFVPADAVTVAGWPLSAQEATQWCSRVEVTAETVVSWAAQVDVEAFALDDGPDLIAYGELWTDDEEGEVELARLIVAPGRRGQGVGRHLVRALTQHALIRHPTVIMRVHPDNAVALRSYLGAGFEYVPAGEAAEWNHRQPVPYVWMRLTEAPAGRS